mmetsp:Transcript_67400/g.161658  ORF Transcript_67400/g.161658 Transcript_67400/m.161658 type:complete len:274 (+) Transcript_67400:3-824(+)
MLEGSAALRRQRGILPRCLLQFQREKGALYNAPCLWAVSTWCKAAPPQKLSTLRQRRSNPKVMMLRRPESDLRLCNFHLFCTHWTLQALDLPAFFLEASPPCLSTILHWLKLCESLCVSPEMPVHAVKLSSCILESVAKDLTLPFRAEQHAKFSLVSCMRLLKAAMSPLSPTQYSKFSEHSFCKPAKAATSPEIFWQAERSKSVRSVIADSTATLPVTSRQWPRLSCLRRGKADKLARSPVSRSHVEKSSDCIGQPASASTTICSFKLPRALP